MIVRMEIMMWLRLRRRHPRNSWPRGGNVVESPGLAFANGRQPGLRGKAPPPLPKWKARLRKHGREMKRPGGENGRVVTDRNGHDSRQVRWVTQIGHFLLELARFLERPTHLPRRWREMIWHPGGNGLAVGGGDGLSRLVVSGSCGGSVWAFLGIVGIEGFGGILGRGGWLRARLRPTRPRCRCRLRLQRPGLGLRKA